MKFKDSGSKTTVLLLTRSLSGGGAQRQLIETAKCLDKSSFAVVVVTLYPGGLLADDLCGCPGVKVISISKKSRYDIVGPTRRFLKVCRDEAVDLIWSYAGGTEYGMIARVVAGTRFVMGLRHAGFHGRKDERALLLCYVLQGWLDRFADAVVANSGAGQKYAVQHGYSLRRLLVVPNGFDTERFSPAREEGMRQRREWGVSDKDFLIGAVGRIDSQKDYETLLRACASVSASRSGVKCVIVGGGSDGYGAELSSLAKSLGIDEIVTWAGAMAVSSATYSAFDVLVLCSKAEGMPNVVAEAMACGTPCVSTRVGDAPRLIDDESRIVPVGDSGSLAEAVKLLAARTAEDLQLMGERDRKRIVHGYSLGLLAERTATVIRGVVAREKVVTIEKKLACLDNK